ncbi:hypothetical protein QBD00_003206 [Ochrobactrum sp. AN78]|nr:hypothetical protein [Ochrobactrum sp. AN78]
MSKNYETGLKISRTRLPIQSDRLYVKAAVVIEWLLHVAAFGGVNVSGFKCVI